MRPYFIEQRLKLRNPIYSETAAYGHMGRTPETLKLSLLRWINKTVTVELFTWEKLRFCRPSKTAFGCKPKRYYIKKNFCNPLSLFK
jgi:S-adenosylmethionine synthetase